MARTISAPKEVVRQDRLLLRAIYYRQKLPAALLDEGSRAVAQRLEAFRMAGLVVEREGRLVLTDLGETILRRLYGERKPPMIDPKPDAFLSRKELSKKEFIVGSSLAAELAREVSGGE